jgi:hypothetical protein
MFHFNQAHFKAGLTDFSWYNKPKPEKYTKSPTNIRNGRKIHQIAIKYTNIFHCKTLKNLPKFLVIFV